MRLTGLCLPHLERSPAGRVVNITSSTVKETTDNLALSNAVRPAVIGWAKSLARELGPRGITVNSIAPGRIDTERIREVYPDGPSEADLQAIPLRRLGTPREIGDLVAFLCSDRAAYVTGTVISGRRWPYARGLALSAGVRLRSSRHPACGRRSPRLHGAVGAAVGRVHVFAGQGEAARRERSCARRLDQPEAGDVYDVDVLVGKASLLEQLLPFTRPEGSTLVPAEAYLPPRRLRRRAQERQVAAQKWPTR